MNKLNVIFTVFLLLFAATQAYGDAGYQATSNSSAISSNQISTSQSQNVTSQGFAQGGNSTSDSDSVAISGDSGAIANISTNSTSNYETRTPPVSMFPPYLPTFAHGGWGTIQGYFPNGPTSNDQMYERAFYTSSKADMKELKGVMNTLPYDGPLDLVGGILNCVGTLLGGPDNFHHGKGFEISNSLVRKRRPKNLPLYIMIDSNINRNYLDTSGYTYVGKISLEGKVERNWDLVYKAAIAEALPWDVDIMLVSGGMKGVTVGTNTTFPGVAGAYSQTNYSISMLGGQATGMTEGKGVAMVSAECYRYNPKAARRRSIPEVFYETIHSQNVTSQATETAQITEAQKMIQAMQQEQILQQTKAAARTDSSFTTEPSPKVQTPQKIEPRRTVEPKAYTENNPVAQNITKPRPTQNAQKPYTGVTVSQKLYEMAGF